MNILLRTLSYCEGHTVLRRKKRWVPGSVVTLTTKGNKQTNSDEKKGKKERKVERKKNEEKRKTSKQ